MGSSIGGQKVWDQVVEDKRYGIKWWRTEGMGSSSGGHVTGLLEVSFGRI